MVTSTYDNLNRLIKRDIQTGTGVLGVTSETYMYDALGRLISGTDNLGNTENFEYDSLNRLISEDGVHYTYDSNGNITGINGTDYAYDISNRLTSISKGTQSIANYTYDSLSLQSQTLGNGVSTNYTYDVLQRLASL